MNEDYRPQKPPRSTLTVDMKHTEDLQEPDASDGRGGEHLTIGAHGQDDDGRRHHDQVWIII